jgi:hypothetical protein
MKKLAYRVPKELFVCFVLCSMNSLDKPKSAIFGDMLSSNNILAGFKSK